MLCLKVRQAQARVQAGRYKQVHALTPSAEKVTSIAIVQFHIVQSGSLA